MESASAVGRRLITAGLPSAKVNRQADPTIVGCSGKEFRMTTETRAIIAKARADIAAHVLENDAYRPITTTLLDAVEALVTAVINQATVDQTRVESLEAQVRVLASTVLSITESVCQSAPAIIALQDEMAKEPGAVDSN
jgi:hypothetical protein